MSGIELLGAAISAAGSIAGGVAAKNDADFEAAQMEQRGNEELAASQREAIAKRKEGALVNSRQQAIAAASGAGAGFDAPTIVKLMADTTGQADYNARTSLYGGEQRRRGMFDSASARRRSGRSTLLGSLGDGVGSLVKVLR